MGRNRASTNQLHHELSSVPVPAIVRGPSQFLFGCRNNTSSFEPLGQGQSRGCHRVGERSRHAHRVLYRALPVRAFESWLLRATVKSAHSPLRKVRFQPPRGSGLPRLNWGSPFRKCRSALTFAPYEYSQTLSCHRVQPVVLQTVIEIQEPYQ